MVPNATCVNCGTPAWSLWDGKALCKRGWMLKSYSATVTCRPILDDPGSDKADIEAQRALADLEQACDDKCPCASRTAYPDPTPEMLNGDPMFDAIWNAIKGWDISRHNDGLYSGPTGNDARHIYDAIRPILDDPKDDRKAQGAIAVLEQARDDDR